MMIRRIEGELAGKSRGRTVYVGSNKSPVQLRIYEKGHEQRGKAITTAQAEKYSLDWVRSELQVRPEKGARAAASGWQPEEAWGASRWAQDVLERILGLVVQSVPMREWAGSDDERALGWMLHQYGNLLARLHAECNTWEQVGNKLGRELERMQAENVSAAL